jgi:hypothetical protein
VSVLSTFVESGVTDTAVEAVPVLYEVTTPATVTLTAATVKLYAVPAVRPLMVQLVVEARQKNVSVESLTKYFCVEVARVDESHQSVTEVAPAIAETPVGAAVVRVEVAEMVPVFGLATMDAFHELGEAILMKTGTAPTVYGVMRKL